MSDPTKVPKHTENSARARKVQKAFGAEVAMRSNLLL